MQKKLHDYLLDEHMDLFVLIKSAVVRTAKNGREFLAMTFEDKSGEMDGMYWGVTKEEIEQFKPKTIVQLQAIRQVYQDKPQLKITSISKPTKDVVLNPTDFVNVAPIKRSEMEKEISEVLFKITNPYWNRIVRQILEKNQETFYTFPAAKTNHHAFQGGLAYHTLSIVRLAQSIANQYEQVNEGLLIAGAILHDIGKTIELSGPVGTTYTIAGNLIGHISIADSEIVLAANELNFDLNMEDVLILRHVVLAHHGLLEYGSPVRPSILEADILHHLDDLDASIQMFSKEMERTNPGEFSNRVYALDKRMIYKPKK